MYRPPSVVELPDDLETLRLALPAIHNVLREIFAHEKTTLEVRRTGCRIYSVRAIPCDSGERRHSPAIALSRWMMRAA